MVWKSVCDNGSPQVQGDAQKHEEFEVYMCKIALRHRRPVGTDGRECSSVPTGRSSSQGIYCMVSSVGESREIARNFSLFSRHVVGLSGPICPRVAGILGWLLSPAPGVPNHPF